jgi:pyrimidine deaminase RibD-like protein
MFARYSAGLLPADALKSFVRQVQAERKAKKSGEDIVNSHRWRVSLKPELGGGVVEVMATDPIDAKKQAIIQQPNWRFVDNDAMTIERLDEPAAGASTTQPHPQGRGRPNDPNGRYAIVRRDDPRNYRGQWGSEPPDYLFRFSLPDGFTQAQMRSVMSAWAARENADAGDYMMVDTTQFAAPAAAESNQGNWGVWVPSLDRFATTMGNSETRRFMRHGDAQAWIEDFNARNAGSDLELSVREIEPTTAPAPPESGSVQWNIVADDGDVVHTFWNRNVQADANQAALAWVQSQSRDVAGRGPFEVVPAAIPGSTQDLQRRRMAADAAANTRRWADYEASQTPTPIAGVQDIEPDVEQYTSQPAQTQWEVYDRSTDRPVFRMYAADQAEAWRKGQEWVANYARMTPDQPIYGIDYSVRQSTAPVTEGREITKLHKLDSVLEKCIEMIRRGHESDPERYGRVAACLIDNKNNHTYAINMPGPDGTRRHAERMAIDKHLESHGRIGPNAIMITTLSPCVDHMDERYGESCTDLLSDYGIEKCYAGWQDPTQHPAVDYPFNLKITDRADIFNTCRDIAASFLPQAMVENFADGRNPQDKGDSKRHGINTKASVSSLRKTAKQGGRKGQLAHWLANMKSGRAKAKRKTNEDTVATINLGDIIVNLDDHALDRQQQRGIDDKSFDSAIRKLKLPRVIKQMSQLEVGNRFYVLDHTTNVALGMRKIGDVKYVLKTVYVGRPADYNIAEIITV